MKEYLENRIIELKNEYSKSLTKSAKSNLEMNDVGKNILWQENVYFKARLNECKLTLEFFNKI